MSGLLKSRKIVNHPTFVHVILLSNLYNLAARRGCRLFYPPFLLPPPPFSFQNKTWTGYSALIFTFQTKEVRQHWNMEGALTSSQRFFPQRFGAGDWRWDSPQHWVWAHVNLSRCIACSVLRPWSWRQQFDTQLMASCSPKGSLSKQSR